MRGVQRVEAPLCTAGLVAPDRHHVETEILVVRDDVGVVKVRAVADDGLGPNRLGIGGSDDGVQGLHPVTHLPGAVAT